MKLAVVYNPNDPKLSASAYSWTYRDMFLAVLDRFAPVVHVTEGCEASAIEAHAILFYDVHSSHHIEIAGLDRHPAVKLEYFNDPHQAEQRGQYRTGRSFHKLSARQRAERAKRRGVRWIICPYRGGFERFIQPHAAGMELLWFPVAPADRRPFQSSLAVRRPEVLGNGHCWPGEDGFRPYEFRRWAFGQPQITAQPHSLDGGLAAGASYQAWLSQFAGALALCDDCVVPKYLEVPLAGCVCFCQMLPDYGEMGFADGINCVAVDRGNFAAQIEQFKADPQPYQRIADAGRATALNFTAARFADRLYAFLESKIKS
jgi:hypothetical protein